MSTARTAAAQKTATPTITAAPTRILQRQCACGAHAAGGECEDCKKQKGVLSRKVSGHGASDTSAACEMSAMSPHLVAEALRSPGEPLDRDTRAFMESRFQHDFSAVRVHTDARAAASARALRARAWALGSDVAFATGAYAPGTATGRRLLAHELTHVVQQERAPVSAPRPDTELNVSEPGDASEREADRVADHVADSSPLVVRSQAVPDAIQLKGWDDLSGWEKAGIVGGGVAVAGIIGYLIWRGTRKGPEDIDNEPHCGPRQNEKIVPALIGARQWAATARDRLRAYQARPRDPANLSVDAALKRRFRSADPPVVEKVERVIGQVHAILSSGAVKSLCHTKKEPTCEIGPAFAPRGVDEIHFCQSFFKKDQSRAIEIIIHELSHSLVGGAWILDRGYERERRFGGGTEPNRLNVDENLTNAESYAEFVADLATGKVYGEAPPSDILECPDDWKEPVKETMAFVQRVNTSLSVDVAQAGATAGQLLAERWKAQHGPADMPTVDVVKATIKAVFDQLYSPIRIICNADPRGRCSQGDVEWDDAAKPPSITLCATWKPKTQPERTASLLAGLYGWIGKMDNAAWRTTLAQIAVDTLNTTRYGPPKHEDVFGSAAWTPDLLRIHYTPTMPRPKQGSYEESGTLHQRQSADTPTFMQTDCKQPTLKVSFVPFFFIDKPAAQRPGPYGKPRLSVKYTDPKAGAPKEKTDTGIPRDTPGMPVETKLQATQEATFDKNGTFVVDVVLDDPDSKTTRTYHDEIKVEPVLACPDAISGADPATPPRPDAISGADPAAPPTPDAISGADPAAPSTKPVRVQRAPDDEHPKEPPQ